MVLPSITSVLFS
jgi:hypothetical protein